MSWGSVLHRNVTDAVHIPNWCLYCSWMKCNPFCKAVSVNKTRERILHLKHCTHEKKGCRNWIFETEAFSGSGNKMISELVLPSIHGPRMLQVARWLWLALMETQLNKGKCGVWVASPLANKLVPCHLKWPRYCQGELTCADSHDQAEGPDNTNNLFTWNTANHTLIGQFIRYTFSTTR